MLLQLLAFSWKEFALYQQQLSNTLDADNNTWILTTIARSLVSSLNILCRPVISVMQWDSYNDAFQHSISVLVRLYRPRSLVRLVIMASLPDCDLPFQSKLLRGIHIDGIEHLSNVALPRLPTH
jgi:hypothetical protein